MSWTVLLGAGSEGGRGTSFRLVWGPREQHLTGSQGWASGGKGSEARGLLWVPRCRRQRPGEGRGQNRPCLATSVSRALPGRGPSRGASGSQLSRGTYPRCALKPGPGHHSLRPEGIAMAPNRRPTTSLDGGGRSRTQRPDRCLAIGVSPRGPHAESQRTFSHSPFPAMPPGQAVRQHPSRWTGEAAEAPAEAGKQSDLGGAHSLFLSSPQGAKLVSCPGVPGQGQARGLRDWEAGPGPPGPVAGAER